MHMDVNPISAALARSALVLGETPQPLPGPGPFQKWVLESPLAPGILLAVVGVVLFFILRGQGKERQGRTLMLVLVVLGGGIIALGSAVTTPAERLRKRTRVLVEAVAKVSSTTVAEMLDTDATVSPFGFGRDEILRRLERDIGGAYRVKEYTIQELRSRVDGPNAARSQVRVRVVGDNALYSVPIGSWWMITWRKDRASGEWKVRELEMQHLDGFADVGSIRP